MDDSSSGVPFTMPVAPAAYGGGYGGGFGGGFGGDGWWIILLLLFAGGGWGNGFGGGWGGGDLYPWLNNSNQINGGFRDQMINDNITGIRSDLGDISTQLCNGFNGTQVSILQGVNGLQSQLAQSGYNSQLATQDLKYTIATEESATRTANAANTQAVLDKLCQLELDGYKRENDSLRSQLTAANLAASQVAQTAELRTAAATIANQAIAEMRSCPIPSQPVYGNTPIFSCSGNSGGCGCSG